MTPPPRRGWILVVRVLVELALMAGGIVALLAIAKGLAPVVPGLASALRALLHPVVLAVVVGAILLARTLRGRRRDRRPRDPGSAAGDGS